MSDSVIRMRIDSKEYDANIKRAGQALTDYFKKVKEGGGTLKYLDEGVLEAVQAMGKLGTQANSVKGGLRELTQATSDMTVVYRSLTDEERNSPLGEAMAQSIQQMTERAGELQDTMGDVQQSIRNVASDTQRFDQIAAVTQGVTAGFQTVTGAAKLMGIQMGDDVEIIAKLQAAMAVTTGFQTMQNLLQKQSALMQGVNALQKEFNILAKANPYVLLATAAAAVVAAYVAWTSGARDAEKAQKALNGEIEATRTQLSQIDKDTDFSVGVAEAAGKSWKAIHELRLEAARTKLQLADMNYDKLAASGVASAEQIKKAAEMQQQAWDNVMKVLNEGTIHDIKMRNGGGSRTGGGRTSGSRSTTAKTEDTNFASDSIMAQQKEVQRLTDLWQRASGELRDGYLTQLDEAKAKLEQMQKGVYDAGSLNEVIVKGNINRQYSRPTENNIGNVISNIQNELKNADIGSAAFESISARLADANAYKTLIEEGLKAGMSNIAIDNADIWKQIINGDNIPDSTWQAIVDEINEKLEELELEPITIDFETGKIDKVVRETEKLKKTIGTTAQVVGTIGQAFNAIEDPAAKVAGTVAQAIANIAMAYSDALAKDQTTKFNIWGFIAAAAASTISMASTIAAIHSQTGYAEGGIIKGNHYSGDMLDGGSFGINAGELVLNRAQQGSLASQLEGGGLRNLRMSAEVKGEQIVLVANRYFRRTGQGEIVTWK